MWPPGYYTLRDRMPFLLTHLYLIYLLKPDLRRIYKPFTTYLVLAVVAVTSASLTLCLTDNTLNHLFGISWTYPAPIEWGTYTLAAYTLLRRRGIPGFEAIYLSLITALAGGWIYEIPRWINVGDYWGILNPNAAKVYFIRFQILCVPIAAAILQHRTRYTPPRHWGTAAALYLGFSILIATTRLPRYMDRIIDRSWCWIARVPTQLAILYTLTGVGGPADE